MIRLAPQRATYDLLAEKLGSESADAEHVGDSPCVPTFAQHGNGDDAADLLPEAVGDSNRGDNFPKDLLIRKLIGLAMSPCALNKLATERSISSAAATRNCLSRASPDSSCSLSMSNSVGPRDGLADVIVISEEVETSLLKAR